MPEIRLPRKAERALDIFLEKTFLFLNLLEIKEDFPLSDIQMRSACFINEARKRGVKIKSKKGRSGYTNYFSAEINKKEIRFEGLPLASHKNKYSSYLIDCKEKTKKYLKRGGFPTPDGKCFSFWKQKKALSYAINEIGFPLVVKPRRGSVSRHVTTNIKNEKELKEAIHKAVLYSPFFIIEKFIKDSFVYRATVIDFDYIAIAKQIPANVVGDGVSTIEQLTKNKDKKRGELYQKEFLLHKIVIDKTTANLLKKKKYNLRTVPKKNELIYLQEDSFLRLGGDIIEETKKAHKDNIKLIKDVTKFFDVRVVGIDIILSDIAISWKEQEVAILELNSLPCIEMHQFPSSGTPENVSKQLVNLFFKYYL